MGAGSVAVLRVLALWVAGLGAAGQFAKFAVAFPALQAAYPDAGTSLGFLVSLISLLGVFLGLIAGLVIGRIGSKSPLLWALLLGAAMSALQALLPPMPVMLASRIVEGLSHLGIVVAAPTLIAQFASDRLRPFALTLWSTFFGVAFALTGWLGLPFAAAHGLGALLLAHAAWMAGMAALLWLLLPAERRTDAPAPVPSPREVVLQHVRVYASPWTAAPAIGWVFYTACFVSLMTVLPGFIDPAQRLATVTAMPLAGIAVAMTVSVALMRRIGPVATCVTGFALAGAITVGLGLFPGAPLLCVALFGALGLVQSASFAAIPALNPTALGRAYGNGAIAQTGNVGNVLGTPLLLATVAVAGYSGLIGFALICCAMGVLAHLFSARRRARGTSP